MQQAFFGVCAAIAGREYDYWYPLQMLSSGYTMLRQSSCAADQEDANKRKRDPKAKNAVAGNAKNTRARQKASNGNSDR